MYKNISLLGINIGVIKMKEKWLLITNWENYAVSNTGKIKNIKTGKFLKKNIISN